MNADFNAYGLKRTLRPLALALALAIPGGATFADALEGDCTPGCLTQAENAAVDDSSAYAMQSDERYMAKQPLQGEYLIIVPSDTQDGVIVFEDEPLEDEDLAMIDDGTAKEFNRGYYAEPEQSAVVMIVPADLDQIEAMNTSDDGTARQFDRGYYRDPDTVAAVVMEPNDTSTLWPQDVGLITAAQAD